MPGPLPAWIQALIAIAHERTNQGMLEPGNLNLRRPAVGVPGGAATVRSMSFADSPQGPEILIPTVLPDATGHGRYVDWDGRAAIRHFRRTGQHLGKFATPEDATRYAKKLHVEYEKGWYD